MLIEYMRLTIDGERITNGKMRVPFLSVDVMRFYQVVDQLVKGSHQIWKVRLLLTMSVTAAFEMLSPDPLQTIIINLSWSLNKS
jgi:hypothetical protein